MKGDLFRADFGEGDATKHFSVNKNRERKKPININIFGRTVSGTNRNRPWDKWDPSSGQTSQFLKYTSGYPKWGGGPQGGLCR